VKGHSCGIEARLAADAVLIVGGGHDVHVERVAALLARQGVPVFTIELDCFPRDYHISLVLERDAWAGELRCKRTDRTLDAGQIRSVWMRKPADFAFSAGLSRQEEAFARGEANHCLLGWLNGLDCFFMSHPTALRSAIWKLEQLARARRFGFDVPATLLSNVPEKVHAFVVDGARGAIYKTLSTPTLAAEKVVDGARVANGLHTTMVAPDDPDLESVGVLPGQFQHYIEKAYEVRVTVVAGTAFAAKIDSQANERTRIDFRHFDADVEYNAIDLPGGVADRCCEFVASYGLTFGAIDLIATPDGRYVFLENNPVGQFVFVEELVPQLEISKAVAAALAQGKGL
jgi:glutathione synthase/RimK-type ligase-like ATP-grasp enzyme